MSESDFPEVPVTAAELAVRWAQRDAEYAKMRPGLSPDAENAVREGRKREAIFLPRADRARMWRQAQAWVAPKHEDFGSMKDWLS